MRRVGWVALWVVTGLVIAGGLGAVAYLAWFAIDGALAATGAPVILRAMWAMTAGVAWVAATVSALVTLLDG